jgi:O-antigen/teichoic acid export membrane protein
LANPNDDRAADVAPAAAVADQSAGVRDTSIMLVTKVVALIIGFLASAYFIPLLLGPEGKGSLSTATAFASLLTVIFMLGTDVGCLYYVAARKLSPSEAVAAMLLYSLAGSVVAVGVGLGLMWFSGLEYFTKAPAMAFYLAVLSIPLSFFGGTLTGFLSSLGEFLWFAIISTACVLLGLAGVLVFVGLLGWGVEGALLSLILMDVLSMVSTLTILRRRYNLGWTWPSAANLRQTFSFGVRYYFGKISNNVNFQLGTLVLASMHYDSREDIGFFSQSMTLVSAVLVVSEAVGTVLLPRVATDEHGRVQLVAQCIRGVGVATAVLLAIGCALCQPFLALALPKFLPCVVLILALAPGFLIRATSKVVVPYLHSRNRVGITSWATAAGVVANLAGLWVALHYTNPDMAAVVGVVANYVVSSVILAWAFREASGLGLRETWLPRWSDVTWIWGAVWSYARKSGRAVRAWLRGAGSAGGQA